ncbi:MAG: ester cyclase, partial [Chloroflexi bacterium]|nr:ester cyclase [Chloroflexota bacterium]
TEGEPSPAHKDDAGARGLERHQQLLAWHRGVLPDQHFEIEDVVADASRGAVRWTLTGTQHAEFLVQPGVDLAGDELAHVQSGLP